MSLRDQMVELLAAQPGMTSAQLREAMSAMGLNIGKNEPANTLNVMTKQGRVRHEGEMPARRYYAVAGAAAPQHGGSKPGRTLAKAATAAEQSATPPQRPAPPVVTAADLVRQQLADAIHEHLATGDGWHSAEDIAADLDEGRQPVALAVADLMRAGRVTRRADASGRWVYQDKRAGDMHVAHAAPAAMQEVHAAPAPEAVAAPAPAAAKTQPAERVSSNGNPAPESFVTETPPRQPRQHPVARAEVVAEVGGKQVPLGEVLSRMKLALKDPVPVDFPYAIGLEITAVEDLLGDACDARLPHDAIKALVLAQGSLRRAVAALQQRTA